MPKDGGRMRIIDYDSVAIDLSRTDTGLIRLRIGAREAQESYEHIDLYPGDARVLAHSLLAAAERERPKSYEDRNEASDWPEEYWAKGSFPDPRSADPRGSVRLE